MWANDMTVQKQSAGQDAAQEPGSTPSPDSGPGHDQVTIFRPQSRYGLFAMVAALMAVLFAWNLAHQMDFGALFFFVACLAIVVWSVRQMLARVEVDATGLTVYQLPGSPRRIEFRQVAAVHEGGRFLKLIVLVYQGLRPDGLVDPDDTRSVALPSVEDQAELLDLLAAHRSS